MKKNKKAEKGLKNKATEKSFTDESLMNMSIHLDQILKGLRVDIFINKRGAKEESFVVSSIDDNDVSFYPLQISEHPSSNDFLCDINAGLAKHLKTKKQHGK